MGGEGLQSHIGQPNPGVQSREMNPLSWFENQWELTKGCKRSRVMKSEHTHLLTPRNKAEEADEQKMWPCLGTWLVSWNHPSAPWPTLGTCSKPSCSTAVSTRMRAAVVKWYGKQNVRQNLARTKLPQTQPCTWTEQSSHCWHAGRQSSLADF